MVLAHRSWTSHPFAAVAGTIVAISLAASPSHANGVYQYIGNPFDGACMTAM